MNYRVYVKKAKDNIIGDLVRGTLNGSTGVATEASASDFYITKNFLSVDYQHTYELVLLFRPNISYWICEYDSNYSYLNGHSIAMQDRSGNDKNKEKVYAPTASNVKYVKLQILDATNYPDSGYFPMMFLRSADPILIHDSNSPDKEYHLIDPNLQLGDSSAGSFEFIIYPGHSYYQNKINLFTDTFYITRTYKNGSEKIIWDGRAITEEIDADGNKSYHCEGALSYLNDIRVARSQYGSTTATVYEFINDYIVAQQSWISRQNNRMDRSFYSYKENGQYVDTSSIFCNQGTRYAWNINYESGLKWINDIQQSFGGHMKIRYRDYDSVKDDIICRSFTYVQDFDRTFTIPDFKTVKIDTQVKRGSIFSYKQNLRATRTVYSCVWKND